MIFRVAKRKREELERQLEQETQQRQLNLDPTQIAEYRDLKNEAEKRTSIASAKIFNYQQEQETDGGIVSHETRQLEQCNFKIKEVRF